MAHLHVHTGPAPLAPETTVGALVTVRPARSRVFEKLGIDFCCGGKIPLADACAKKNLDVRNVINLIRDADAARDLADASFVDANLMSLSQLADHIEQTHHAYLREELPRLDAMTAKVAAVHGDKEPRLLEVRNAFVALKNELLTHMMKEEQILFPVCRRFEAANNSVASHCGSIANPIRQMEAEHDNAGNALAIMNQATDGYLPPAWACNTYRAMLDGLAVLERDMHQHVHKENNILFPKAIARETELLAA